MFSHLTGRWPEVSAQSVLDILLVAVLIYEFLKLIKGTRAMPVLFGVGSLALACDELGESAFAPGNLVAYHRPAVSRVLLFFVGDHGRTVC